MFHNLATSASVLLVAASLAAQTSTASTVVDQFGNGCQGPNGFLTGGAVGTAEITVNYDAGTGIAEIVVDNITPVVAGEATAVITEVYLNLPAGAVSSAMLMSQAGAGGATPAFTLTFDADTGDAPNANSVACFGDFNIGLDNGNGVHRAIANAAGTTSAPNPVIGPVTFELQLAGPGTGGIDAEGILASFSMGAPSHESNATVKFQSAGVNGEESGFVGSGDLCRTSVYSVGTPQIGHTIDICITGGSGCHACLWISDIPGPFMTPLGFEVPIGLPLLLSRSGLHRL
jgi:hypothetical protein